MRTRCLVLVALLPLACQKKVPSPGGEALARPVAEGKALLDRGQLDEALTKLQAAPEDPDGLYYQGRVWARKAESAPLPTPPPLASPLPRGAEPPPAPEFKPEELRALELFARALAARSDHAQAHLAVAELLAPHALRRQELEREAAARRGRKGQPVAIPTPEAGGIDYSVGRVLQAYQLAAQADPVSTVPAEGLIGFGVRVGRLDAAETGYQELLRRVKESPEPFIRYGDFLATQKRDLQAAIEQYRQALIWKPDDDATRAKVAEIYISRGIEYFGRQQYALAEGQFKEAEKYVTDRSSSLAQRLQSYSARLREIRQPPGR